VRAHWGMASQLLTDLIAPGVAPQAADAFVSVQRDAATPETAARLLEAFFEADASPLLPRVTVPALILHYSGDRAVPFRAALAVAERLPHARLVPLEGPGHLPADADLPRVLTLIDQFLSA